MINANIGYTIKRHETKTEQYCLLTIGSIIVFNGSKKIVTHTDGHRQYKHGGKYPIDITLGYKGYLKDFETGKEQRSNWYNVTKDKILHFENLDLVNL